MTNCYNKITKSLQNEKCAPNESCGHFINERAKDSKCIKMEYCGSKATDGTQVEVICPKGAEKEGVATSASIIPSSITK